MVGAMQQTSKFDEALAKSMDGGNVTLDLKTDRLRQFPEAYEMLQHISDPDHRILMKQQVIFEYEPLLRKQIKQEKKKRKKEKQRELELRNPNSKAKADLKEKEKNEKKNEQKVKPDFQDKGVKADNQPEVNGANANQRDSEEAYNNKNDVKNKY